jgi:hypothetical protein
VERELLVAVAVLRAANAGEARVARQAARLGDEAPRVAGDDVEAAAPDRAGWASGDAGRRTSGATVAGRRRGWQRAIEHQERPVGPPGAEAGVNLQPERPGSAQARRATDPLEGNQRLGVEGEGDRVGDGQRRERCAGRARDDARGVAIERVGRTVGRLGLAFEQVEERRAARPDDQRGGRARQELRKEQRRGRLVEGRG